MADVITLSDDDFSAPGSQRRTRKRASTSGHTKDKAAKQWDDIFSQGSRREKRKHDSDSHRSSQRSSERSSKRSSDKSSGHSSRSHRSSERQSHHSRGDKERSSRGDKERHRGKRSSSGKSVIELDVSDEDTNSSAITSKKASPEKVSSGKSSKESPSHHHSKKSSNHRHRSKSPNHHHSKKSSHEKSSSEKNSSEKSSSEKNSEKNSQKNASEKSTASSGVTANGRHSGSRRSLAAELGTSKAECKRDDDDRSSRRSRHTTNGKHSKPDAEPASDDESSKSKRRARGAAEAVPAAKRVRLTRVEPDAESDASSAPPPEPEPEPCQQSLEELCTLLKPLLSGPELKLEAKVRRRHAAVLELAAGRSGRRQHLTGVTQQSAERLRAEPGRCFTVLRGFLEQLDQLKIVASSAQSRTAPAPAEAAARKVKTGTAAGNDKAKTGTAAGVVKVDAGTTAATDKKAAADAAKASPSPSVAMNGSAQSVASSEQDEKEARRHRRHVAKLEKTLRRLEREIVRQDQMEVDWEDATGSSYMVGARLKRRYVQVYRYYCKLVGADEEAQRLDSRRIRFDGTRYPEINRRIEKFVNQTREFPDFKDVLSLIETANRRGRLKLGPGALDDQAKEAFLQLGALLQKRRRAALAESMDSLAGVEEWRGRDPAAGDAALVSQLAENAASGKKKLNEVFKEFVQRQETAAAERRQRREDASADSDEDEEEEEEDTEEAEESEVTDEELEQQTPKPTGGDMPDSDMSDEDGALSDAEMGEADEGVVKEDPDREGEDSKGKELEGADCVKTEESVADGLKVEGTGSGTGNEGGGPSGAEQVSNDKTETAQPDAEDSGDSSAENKGTEVLEEDATSQKSEDNDNLDLLDEAEHVDGAAEDSQGGDAPDKSPNVAGDEAEQRTENGGSTEAKNKNIDPVHEAEKSGSSASAE